MLCFGRDFKDHLIPSPAMGRDSPGSCLGLGRQLKRLLYSLVLRLSRLMKVIGQGFKLKEGKFRLDIRMTNFYGEGSETL